MLGHVLWGQERVRHLATGSEYSSRLGAPGAAHPGQLVPHDPVGTWRAARQAGLATLSTDTLKREVSLPGFGNVALEVYITALVTDFLAHAWDIGAPAGLEVVFDPELLRGCLDWARATVARGPAPATIGPEIQPPAGADDQTRLLALLGRDAASPAARVPRR